MSARTILKFTLGSGSTPTPDNIANTVYAPNTGGNNTSGDQMSGTVFSTLFAVIGIAALITLLVRYLKKNRKISFAERGSFHIPAKSRILVTSAFILAIAFLGSTVVSQMYKNDEKRAEAASTELGVSAAEELTFNVDRSQQAVVSDTISVDNQGAAYTLYMYTTDSRFCLNGTNTCLSSVEPGIMDSELASIGENEWGISLKNTRDPEALVWGSAPVGENGVAIYEGSNPTTSVDYAVYPGASLPDGEYYGVVYYFAISKDDPTKIYRVITHNGFVNREGDKTEDEFNSGIQVWIRHNCGTKKFISWYIHNESLKSNAEIKQQGSENLFYFTMPANDVELTAVCEGDPTPTPESEIKIVYDKNAETATGTTPDTNFNYDDNTVTLQTNGFTYTDYTFLGWSCNKDATSGTYKSGQSGVSVDELKRNCPYNDESTPEVITVYAIWVKEPKYLQDVTQAYCDNMNVLDTKTLKDRRDDKEYSFRKYADGRCWFLSDLDYRPSNDTKLTAADTDIPSDSTQTFSALGGKFKTQSDYGTLYNYKAATAGTYTGSEANGAIIPGSLCPHQWKIPNANNERTGSAGPQVGEFMANLVEFNVGQANGGGENATTAFKRAFIWAANDNATYHGPHFTYNGSWDFSASDWANSEAKSGNYASYYMSTIINNHQPYAFNPHKSGDVFDLNSTNPAHGSSVRCLLRTDAQMADRTALGPDWKDQTIEPHE